MQRVRILAFNFGSTSSKIAYYINEELKIKATITHSLDELNNFASFWDQEEYRVTAINSFLTENGINKDEIDVFVCWGGHCQPVEGGVYRITGKFLDQVKSMKYGHHPGDLAPFVARNMAGEKLAISVDPPTIDEFMPLARYTGIKEITRKSRMQTLNQKAVARKYAREHQKGYDQCNLIVCHMGGGISVVSHLGGRMVDANNGLDGDGPMASNRAGTLPAGDLIDLCYSGKYSHEEVRRLITGNGGLVNYLGESDCRAVEKRISEGDAFAREVYEAMIYQIAKQIASAAVVFKGKVDAILLTGGVANSGYVVRQLNDYVGFIAEIIAYPGELEMESLAYNAYQVMIGKEEIKEI